jgi:hypothetical protein
VIDREKYLERQRRYNRSARGRARVRNYRERQLDKGLCQSGCGRPLASAASLSCNECLDKKISPLQLLRSRGRSALRRRTLRLVA